MTAQRRLKVHLDFGVGSTPLLLGECLWVASQKAAAFEWSEEAFKSGYSFSPMHLPLRKGVIMAGPNPFGGLHGMLNDSIPDGFGLRLMNHSLVSAYSGERDR